MRNALAALPPLRATHLRAVAMLGRLRAGAPQPRECQQANSARAMLATSLASAAKMAQTKAPTAK